MVKEISADSEVWTRDVSMELALRLKALEEDEEEEVGLNLQELEPLNECGFKV